MRRAISKFLPGIALPLSDAPLTARINHSSVEDFYILLDNPYKAWQPGDEISGQVMLISRKNLANIAITLSLSGYIKVNGLPLLKLRPLKQVLLDHSIQIFGPDAALAPTLELFNGLYKGEHRFPFVVKLPTKKIYTSIDFGKGAIRYTLKTTIRSVCPDDVLLPVHRPADLSLFRPRALSRLHSQSFSLEQRIKIVEPIDVATLVPPKPKRLVIKAPRSLKLRRTESASSTSKTASTVNSMALDGDRMCSSPHSPIFGPAAEPEARCIQVTMELAQRGFLRGELIPIKLSISHLKPVHNTRGIIVTLARVCRIEHGPQSYVESFRKDLQQLVIPLFIDPVKFLLEISTSLRVPADAFPTITGCPMVSFQYFVEVMLNLSVKPLAHDHDTMAAALMPRDDSAPALSPGGKYSYLNGSDRAEFINTDKFKRLKKFLQMSTEVIIGTLRLECSAVLESMPDDPAALADHSLSLGATPTSEAPQGYAQSKVFSTLPELMALEKCPVPPYLASPASLQQSAPSYFEPRTAVAGPVPALLERNAAQECGMTEKERMRQHEASLLPSEPQFDSDDDQDTVSHAPHHDSPPPDADTDVVPNFNTAAKDRLVEGAGDQF